MCVGIAITTTTHSAVCTTYVSTYITLLYIVQQNTSEHASSNQKHIFIPQKVLKIFDKIVECLCKVCIVLAYNEIGIFGEITLLVRQPTKGLGYN